MSATATSPDSLESFRASITGVLTDGLNVRDIATDADGDLTFRYQGAHYFACFDERDPHFLQICLPRFFEVDARVRRLSVLEACLECNRNVKLVKMYTRTAQDGAEYVSATVEAVLSDSNQVAALLVDRYLDAIQVAVRGFYEAIALPGEEPVPVKRETKRKSRRAH